MQNYPKNVIEKFLRPSFTETEHKSTATILNIPETELSLAQKLARRYIKHQKLKDDLLQYGIATPTPEVESFHSLLSSHGKSNKKSTTKLRRSRSLERPRNVQYQSRSKIEPHHEAVRECDAISRRGYAKKVENKCNNFSSAQQEVQQMRRALKFYTDRLVELKANAAEERKGTENRQTSTANERCLNAQVSRTLYSLTQQLTNNSNSYLSSAGEKPIASCTKAGLTLQQLNTIHKSAIRCLSSFVNQHDSLAQEVEKQQRETTGHRRSPSPLPAPLPSAVLYSQLCSLLEKLSVCYDAHSSVYDPEFIESIRRLKPLSPSANKKKVPSSNRSQSSLLKRSNSSLASRRSYSSVVNPAEEARAVRFENSQQQQKQHFSAVKDISLKETAPVRGFDRRDGVTQTSAIRPKVKNKQKRRSRSPPKGPLLHQLLTTNPSDSRDQSRLSGSPCSPSYHRKPFQRSPCRCCMPLERCSSDEALMASIRSRLHRMEMEASEIRHRWLSSASLRIHERDFIAITPITTNFAAAAEKSTPKEYTESSLEFANFQKPERQDKDYQLSSDDTYFNRIVDIVQNRILEEIVQDSLSAEIDRFETIADQLAEHLLQTELFLCY